MSKKTKLHLTFWSFLIIILALYYWNKDIAFVLLVFLALSAFAESEWSSKRIDRIQDILEEKGIADRFDLVVDDNLRETLRKGPQYDHHPNF